MLERSNLTDYTTASQTLAGRRALFAVLVAATMAAMLWLLGVALSPNGFGILDTIILICFGFTLPWTVIGFWNAVIGLLIMRFAGDPVAAVTPVAGRVRGDEPITAATAIVVCVRNEGPERVIRNIEPMMADLASSGFSDRFHLYVLSDTNDAAVAAIEERQFGALSERWSGKLPLTYRRRVSNEGFKAGNIRDFLNRWGDEHEYFITLDTDSLMPGSAVMRFVRMMQAEPKLGIVQSLVIGLPSTSAFARLFQFGMRLSMRSYTIGAAWWQGDCGPYWGHNAIIRIAPFVAHCHLPVLPEDSLFGGHVLSHDQIEATLMRRAGYEVRVLPEEDLGWEENPPTLVEFARRDLRWCQGNMQYWHFLTWPGLRPVSRYQLLFAILMFLGSPAWIGLLVLGALSMAFAARGADVIDPTLGLILLVAIFVMWFAPLIASAIDVLARSDERRAFGGTGLFIVNTFIAMTFSLLVVPIMWFGHSMFLIGLLFGRTIGWIGQVRDDHSVPWTLAAQNFWPHSLVGWASIIVLAATHPLAIPVALFVAGGLALSIPLAVISARPDLGLATVRSGLGRLPEETAPPAMLTKVRVPALMALSKQT